MISIFAFLYILYSCFSIDSIIPFVHKLVEIKVPYLARNRKVFRKSKANGSWVLMRQFFVILLIPLLLCSTINTNARSSQSTTTVHQTKHALNIIYETGTGFSYSSYILPEDVMRKDYKSNADMRVVRLHVSVHGILSRVLADENK